MVEVTQADRDKAEEALSGCYHPPQDFLPEANESVAHAIAEARQDGMLAKAACIISESTGTDIEPFLESLPYLCPTCGQPKKARDKGRQEERAAVVADLREWVGSHGSTSVLTKAADRFERGEHLNESSPSSPRPSS